MKLHPQPIERKGKKEFVVLPYDEFMNLAEIMHDYEDLKDIRAAKAKSKKQTAIPIDKVIQKLGL